MAVVEYKIHCTTENKWKRWFLDESEDEPTTCPTDNGHTVDLESVARKRTVGLKDVNIASHALQRGDGVPYSVPKAAGYGYEMCDRDFKICCSVYDSKAMHTVANGANGTVTYASARAGAYGNSRSIEVKVGDTGAGHEDRALAVDHTSEEFTVIFGTDSNGDSVVPTASEVATLINTDLSLSLIHLNAVASGDGSGQVATVSKTSLAGGANPSCEDLKINTTTLKEENWGELTLVGVYKDDSGSIVLCADQADATANAILSIWEYTAINPYTYNLLTYELRDGYLIVDPTLPTDERWDHRAYAIGAYLIPGDQGGSLRLFDGYLGPAPNGIIDATSPQTFVLDPNLGPSTSAIRLFLYYPAGSALKHVLRLVTYRPPGTF
jgi:hypothetical protein